MHTAYPILVTIPERFNGTQDNNQGFAGLMALSAFLVNAIEAQGYRATMAHGGLGNDCVLAIQAKGAGSE